MSQKPIDLIVIPYHDWRKVMREGGRTRDAHFIEQFIAHPDVGRVLVINRPMSLPEMVYKRCSWKTPGVLEWENERARLVRIRKNVFVLDYFDTAIVAPLREKKAYFLKAYGEKKFVHEVEACMQHLGMSDVYGMSFNLFAADLFAALSLRSRLFDGWDNFLRFPEHTPIKAKLQYAYARYAEVSDCWTTNSQSNQLSYRAHFDVKKCHVIANGVDPDKFSVEYPIPSDMRTIQRPIIGFGAKVSHLLDCDLINFLTESNPKLSFVLVGQILEKEVFRKLRTRPNFHYLGDKHYAEYPAYVNAFDVCIIPYVVGEREHGGDSIKFYEYLAAGKPVVSTKIEGVSDEYGNTHLAADPVHFSELIQLALNTPTKRVQLPERLTWKYKAAEMLRLLQNT